MLPSTSTRKPALLAAACGVLLLFLGCEKKPNTAADEHRNTTTLNVQEQKLLGTWQLVRTNLYEITGVDSSGAYTGALVGSAACDSNCQMRLTSTPAAESDWLNGTGAPGTCDATPVLWNARQPSVLTIRYKQDYDIITLGVDSLTLSYVYVSDVLKLKSVLFYGRVK